jgi:carboxyl-terminal processing protease
VSLTVLRGSTTEPHIIELTREELAAAPVTGRIAKPGIGLVRIATFTDHTAAELKQQVAALRKDGATSLVIDLRRTADGAPALGVASARLFVSAGTLSATEGRTVPKQTQIAAAGDGDLTLPVALLVDNGTSLAAEVFAAALAGNKRATLVGEHTLGRAAAQELVRLPDGSALWMTTSHFLRPDGTAIHEKGLTPDIAVAEPDVEFGAEPPATDPILDKAIEQLSTPAKAAA